MPAAIVVERLLEDRHCYLIRNCLSPSEQSVIYQDILGRSKDTDNTTVTCMYPTPKTIIFDDNQSTLKFTASDNIYSQLIVQKANASLQKDEQAQQNERQDDNLLKRITCDPDILMATTTSLGVIRYPVPHGNFPEHVDHCNDGSWVYLLSLGCTANFVVRGPARHCSGDVIKKQTFEFKSGDVLVFDPSTDAAIVHGVKSIQNEHGFANDNCSPEDFQHYRFGVQCRVKR